MVEAKGLILQISDANTTGNNVAFIKKFATLEELGAWLAEQLNGEQVIMLTSIEVL